MFTKVGNYAHNALLNGSGLTASSQMTSGAGIGAGIGALNSMVTGESSMWDGAVSGAVTGAALGAGMRYASMKYASGVNGFINSTTDISGNALAGIRSSQIQNTSNFKFSHFGRSDVENKHANFWAPNSTDLKTTRFQHYNPQFTAPTNPTP